MGVNLGSILVDCANLRITFSLAHYARSPLPSKKASSLIRLDRPRVLGFRYIFTRAWKLLLICASHSKIIYHVVSFNSPLNICRCWLTSQCPVHNGDCPNLASIDLKKRFNLLNIERFCYKDAELPAPFLELLYVRLSFLL